jgi:FAD/FMN-containing dehydrogenase
MRTPIRPGLPEARESSADVEATVAACAEHGAPVLNRAGGTSLREQRRQVAT